MGECKSIFWYNVLEYMCLICKVPIEPKLMFPIALVIPLIVRSGVKGRFELLPPFDRSTRLHYLDALVCERELRYVHIVLFRKGSMGIGQVVVRIGSQWGVPLSYWYLL